RAASERHRRLQRLPGDLPQREPPRGARRARGPARGAGAVLKNARVPVLSIAGWSGAGKTTLLVQVLGQLAQLGFKVGVIKHAHHSFDLDHPGKDSYDLRKAGARQMLVASRTRIAHVIERMADREPR